jgi:hypothetical protein
MMLHRRTFHHTVCPDNKKNWNRKKARLNHKIDSNLLLCLNKISEELKVSKSQIIEEGIIYVIEKRKLPSQFRNKFTERLPINFTISPELWKIFTQFAYDNNYRLVNLLELGLANSMKKYNNIIRSSNE